VGCNHFGQGFREQQCALGIAAVVRGVRGNSMAATVWSRLDRVRPRVRRAQLGYERLLASKSLPMVRLIGARAWC
jgi:hypothetical protein